MNILSITGNLGKDCRIVSGQNPLLSFGVGVKTGFGDNAKTVWIDCTLWGKQAEGRLSEYLLKGQQVAVSGELGTREHDGKTYITCRVNQIDLVGGRPDGQARQPQQDQQARQPAPRQAQPQQQQQNQQGTNGPNQDEFSDDIPFHPLAYLAGI